MTGRASALLHTRETEKMTHPHDQIEDEFILALRRGQDVATSATVAHYTRGHDRAYHIKQALRSADKLANDVLRLRKEIAVAEIDVDIDEEFGGPI